jgi:hypothetical protein
MIDEEVFSKTDVAKKMIIFAYADDRKTLKNGNCSRSACKISIDDGRGAF